MDADFKMFLGLLEGNILKSASTYLYTTGNFTLFGVDDAEVEKEEEEEEQEGEADRRYRGSRGYLRM